MRHLLSLLLQLQLPSPHLAFSLGRTTLARRTGGAACACGHGTKLSGTTGGKYVISILKCLEHRGPAGPQRAREEDSGSDERAQAC
ncbi:hypothetical protein BC827DRAFT_1201945 [Russula dissimulans]|nr:hypothetical protein BC827DRAFT_1201945 [Russula dissimulans]